MVAVVTLIAIFCLRMSLFGSVQLVNKLGKNFLSGTGAVEPGNARSA